MAVAARLKGHVTTPEIEVAIMEGYDMRKNIIVPNIQSGMGLHECDILLLRPTGYGVEFEIKLTKSDLMKDFKKEHTHESELIKEMFYVVPANLASVCLRVLPKERGIIMVKKDREKDYVIETIRESAYNPDARKWTDEEKFKLARLGNMRTLKLKKALNKCRRESGK